MGVVMVAVDGCSYGGLWIGAVMVGWWLGIGVVMFVCVWVCYWC